MHFSIPDTHELYADTTAATTTYTVYNIYINGNYHACLRYKQLHALHKQLRGHCAFDPEIQLPEFPPKKLLPLTNGQLETRRSSLEHYLQLIGQDPRIARMPFLQQFLLRAQIDTALAECSIEADNECKILDVLLATDAYDHNSGAGYQLQVNCCVNQNSSALLRNVGHALKISPAMLQYFCLYLVRVQRPPQDSDDNDGEEDTLVLLRRLMDFESPFISRLHAEPCQLMLRKCYWNPTWDLKLQRDAVALNLLYLQTVGDVAREWIIATPDVRHKLRSLQEHGMKKEYLEMARHLPLYGCLQFNTAVVDYPDPETSAIISVGNRELSIRTPRGAKIYETKFRVTRMRCWRVSAMHNTLESRDHPTHLQLSFEYLMSKQTLRWITITSSEAMLMSVSLQSMVDELLNSGGSNESGDELEPNNTISRNGRASTSSSSASSTPSSSTSTTASTCMPSTSSSSVSANYMSSYLSNSSNLSTPVSPTPPVKFLAQRVAPSSKQQHKLTTSSTFSAVFFRNNDTISHNEAFEGIGDDDL